MKERRKKERNKIERNKSVIFGFNLLETKNSGSNDSKKFDTL